MSAMSGFNMKEYAEWRKTVTPEQDTGPNIEDAATPIDDRDALHPEFEVIEELSSTNTGYGE